MPKNQKPKVLMITVRADYGGGPEHIYTLIELLKGDVEFFIACPNEHPYTQRYLTLIGQEKLFEIPHRRFSLVRLISLYHFLAIKKIDIIHSHGKGAGIYGRILSFFSTKPCVHTFHGIHIGGYSRLIKAFYIFLEKTLSLFTKRFIAVSKSEYKQAVDLGISPTNKTVIIENGVKISEQKVHVSVLEQPVKKVISITRFNFQKNTNLLIQIAHNLLLKNEQKIIKFIIIGSGPEENAIKAEVLARDLGSMITFAGFIDNPRSYLIDSFCYISTSRWEGMPLAILEAMALGLPIIATNVTGNKDVVIHGKNGYLFNPENPSEASEYLYNLAHDTQLWKEKSNASREMAVEKYNISLTAQKTKIIYFDILSKKK